MGLSLGDYNHFESWIYLVRQRLRWLDALESPLDCKKIHPVHPKGNQSVGLSRQEYCVGLPFLPQGIFLTQGSNPCPKGHRHTRASSGKTYRFHTQLYPWSVTPCTTQETRISGSLSCGAREVRSPCAWRGGARPGSRVTGGD